MNSQKMNFSTYKFLVLSDLYRVTGKISKKSFLIQVLFGQSFKYIFWMRTCRFLRESKLLKILFYPFALLLLDYYQYKFGISIPFIVDIGSGFYIGHFGCIVVYPECKIGMNCNISHGVTLGITHRGEKKGYPQVGNNVYIGPGAKIIGSVIIGNNAAIGANCVVTKDVPENAVVVGIPGRVISYEGSYSYVCKTDYEDKILKS